MDLWAIDRWSRQDSPLHRASAEAKLVGALLAVAALGLAGRLEVVAALGLSWLLLVASARVPLRAVLLLVGYAMTFAVLYALLSWEGDWSQAALLVLKAGGAATSVLSVIVSTPYPEVFGAMRPWLPSLLVDALLLTYRSLFILLHRWDHLWAALRLRHGLDWRRPGRSLQALAPALGGLLLGAMDRSESLYEAMRVRGYRGRIAPARATPWGWADLLPLGLGLLSLAMVLGHGR